jgi:hypothetical protein
MLVLKKVNIFFSFTDKHTAANQKSDFARCFILDGARTLLGKVTTFIQNIPQMTYYQS